MIRGPKSNATAPARPEGAPAPDGEGVLRALRALQAESWMRRPRWLRAWIDALPPPGPSGLDAVAAEALCAMVARQTPRINVGALSPQRLG